MLSLIEGLPPSLLLCNGPRLILVFLLQSGAQILPSGSLDLKVLTVGSEEKTGRDQAKQGRRRGTKEKSVYRELLIS